jgi:hypothetical protein
MIRFQAHVYRGYRWVFRQCPAWRRGAGENVHKIAQIHILMYMAVPSGTGALHGSVCKYGGAGRCLPQLASTVILVSINAL